MKFKLLQFVLIITLISVNIELDIYVPALPRMLHYFVTTSGDLQWILSINFIGFAIGSLFYGPISDHFGRKKIIISGLIIFVIGSIGCVLSDRLITLIFWRFIQGLGSSAPAVIIFAAIAELYDERKSAQFISIANSVITGSMAAAPIIGNYLTIYFNWRANFIFILILAVFALISMQIIFIEPQRHQLAKKFNMFSLVKGYSLLIKNKQFLILGIIPCLMYASLIAYIANLSLLFIKSLHVTQEHVGYYQAMIMFVFLISSFISAMLLEKFSISFSKNTGVLITVIAGVLLFLNSLFMSGEPMLITIIMALFSFGAAIALGPFVSQALNVYPELKGTSSALLGSIRLSLSSFVIAIIGYTFNGTLLPIALTIFILTLLSAILYLYEIK